MNKKTKPMKNPATEASIPRNQEHMEALQEDVNKFKAQFIKTLSLEDQKKFKAVDKACKILIDAGIIFHLFPHLPCPYNSKINSAWQWNSLCKFGASGDAKADIVTTGEVHESLISAVYNMYYNLVKTDSHYGTMNNFMSLVSECVQNHCKRIAPEVTPEDTSGEAPSKE